LKTEQNKKVTWLMKKLIFLLLLSLFQTTLFAQERSKFDTDPSVFSLGVRSTLSAFNDGDENKVGSGVGGQLRLRFSEKVNSDWFFDYLTSDIGNYAHRTDYHIGWSVLYYPLKKDIHSFKPYMLAGHCFDYSKIQANTNQFNFAERWSSAVQAGLGTHIRLTERLDLSLTVQYMFHLGKHFHAQWVNNEVNYVEEKGSSLEGHLLMNASINYKIGKLWGRK
jgi:opacity protein-like surface antigen